MSKPCGKGRISDRLKCHVGQGRSIVEHTAAWSAGKVAGMAVSNLAVSHGIDPGTAALLGESIVQGLASTAIAAKGANDRDLVTHFLSAAAGAFIGKASIGTDDAIFGGDTELRDWMTTLATVPTIAHVSQLSMQYAGALRKRIGVRLDSEDDRALLMLSIAARRVSQLQRADSMDLDFVQATLDKYGLSEHFDAKKVLRKIGGRRPGKRCKGGWIAAEKQCSDHKSEGKLTAAGKQSARELAERVRDRKGMQDKRETRIGRMPLAEYLKGVSSQLAPDMKEVHTQARSGLNTRRAKAGMSPIGDKPKARAPKQGAKKLSQKKFDETFKKTYFDTRREQELRGVVLISKKDILGKISASHNIPSEDLEKAYDRFKKENSVFVVNERSGGEMKEFIELTYAEQPRIPKKQQKEIAPDRLNAGDLKQKVQYNQQGAHRAKVEGRSVDANAWEVEAKSARIADIKSRQRQVNTTQGEMFGIEETTDLPLFRKRKDSSRRRFDRAIDGGKSKPRATRKKHNCTPKSQQCGSVCIPLTSECGDGSVDSAQDRLKKLKRSGADDIQVQRAKNSIKSRTAGKLNELNEKRIESLRSRVKNSALSGAGKTEGLAELDPHSIEVDPKRFQYKIIGEHTATGSVGSLSGVRKYDPNLAGILQVWKDPADGKTYVVNGHNRLDLGKKLGAESVAVRYLKAPEAKTARAIGALTNIAEGRGDALDAAKFFRDTGINQTDLAAKGIPMREKIATDGLALSKLDDSLFRRTIDGDIAMARAAIVGGGGLDHASQRDLMKLVDKEGKRKNLTDAAIAEMVDIAKSSQTSQETTFSLFGEETVTKSNMIEKAKLQASIRQRLSREKNLFGTVSRGRAADELSRGGNTIDKAKSGEISSNADRSLKQFDQMKNLSGPVSDAINKAASRMASGESHKSVERDLYAEISTIDIFGNRQKRAA
jgi:hypothetical protein